MSSVDRSLELYTDQRLVSERRGLTAELVVFGGTIMLSAMGFRESSTFIPDADFANLIVRISTAALALATLPNLINATRNFLANNAEMSLRRSITSGEVTRSLPEPAGPRQPAQGGGRPY